MERLRLVPHGDAARRALWDAVATVQAGEPLSPVTVAVPSPYVGLALRRGFPATGRVGFANVRFMPLARVAELLGAPELAAQGRRPLPVAVLTQAVRGALAAHEGPFRGVHEHPATVRAVASSVTELRGLDAAARARVARCSPRAAALVAVADEVARRTRAFFDEHDVFTAAAEVAGNGGAAATLRDLGSVVLYLPTRLTPPEEAFVATLAAQGRLTAIVGLTGDADADRAVRELAERLTAALGAPAEPPDLPPLHAHLVVHAPDPVDEVREVVRRVAARAADLPLHRMAILYRNAEPYARLVPQLLDEGKVAWNGPSHRRLAGTVAGRVLLGLLDLSRGDLGRDALTAWMASGPVVDPATRRPVPAHRWDLLSRRAGVVAGAGQWAERLDRLVDGWRATLEGSADALTDGRRRAIEHDVEQATALRSFVAALAERLAPPNAGRWSDLVTWARGLLADHLGPEPLRATWPADEVEAGRRVDAALGGLSAIDELDPSCDLHRFTEAVAAALDAPAARHGAFGTGVFTGPLQAAFGNDFDLVFLVGMTEGAFPPRGHDDPLLPDEIRRGAGAALRLHAHRRLDERRDFLAALAAAPERVVCFPRADPRAQRPHRPARWLLESASALAGTPVGADELLEAEPSPWLVPRPSFEATLVDRGEPASPSELDLGWLRRWQRAGCPATAHPLAAVHPELCRGLTAIDQRASDELGPFDGLVGPFPGLAPAPERPGSPTTLETWATCPFSYLLTHVLHVREVERPEETESLSPLDRGSLVHDALERFFAEHPGLTPGHRWTDGERSRLSAVTRACCDDAEARGVTGRAALWRIERRRIERTVLSLLGVDEAMRHEHHVAPVRLEWSFGFAGDDPVVADLGDDRTLAFRGRVDRIDVSPEGDRVVVLDYKTGSSSRYRGLDDDPVLGGRCLQLAVYGLAAERVAPGAQRYAYYWFVGAPAGDALVGYQFDDARRERLREVLRLVLDGIGSGLFPAVPGHNGGWSRAGNSECAWCPYDRLCPPERARAWERKQHSPAAAPYLALVPGEEADA